MRILKSALLFAFLLPIVAMVAQPASAQGIKMGFVNDERIKVEYNGIVILTW